MTPSRMSFAGARVLAMVIADDATMDDGGKVSLTGIFHVIPITEFPRLGQHALYVAIAGITGDADLVIEFHGPGDDGPQLWSAGFPIRGSVGPNAVHSTTVKANFPYASAGVYHCSVRQGDEVIGDLTVAVG